MTLLKLCLLVRIFLLSQKETDAFKINIVGSNRVKIGLPVTLQCLYPSPKKASSFHSALSVEQWNFNGNLISSRESSRYHFSSDLSQLTIQKATKADSGIYQCTTKSANRISSTRRGVLTVIDRPTIIHHKDVFAQLGSTATLTCSGRDFTDVTWKFNNKNLQADFRYRQRGSKGEHLDIPRVTLGDNGVYTCIAINKFFSAVAQVSLTVLYAPSFSKHPRNASVDTGDYLKISCAVNAVPNADVVWERNNKSIDVTSPWHSVTRDSSSSNLIISFATVNDTGFYRCISNNSIGRAKSKQAYVLVKPHVVFTIEPKKMLLTAGANQSVQCSSKGTKHTLYKWTKDNQLLSALPSKERLQFTSSGALVIFNVAYEDAGKYVCTVQEDADEYSSSRTRQVIYVSVEGPPSSPVLLPPKVILVRNNVWILLNWTSPLEGNSPITSFNVSWQNLGNLQSRKVKPDKLSTLLRFPPINGKGIVLLSIYVEAINDIGIAKSNTQLVRITDFSLETNASFTKGLSNYYRLDMVNKSNFSLAVPNVTQSTTKEVRHSKVEPIVFVIVPVTIFVLLVVMSIGLVRLLKCKSNHGDIRCLENAKQNPSVKNRSVLNNKGPMFST
eukprot:m.279034 g.279034  ORF g.279034 m.279034 type:complete len:614 (+) comp40617_c0_seq4:892-2733(+)